MRNGYSGFFKRFATMPLILELVGGDDFEIDVYLPDEASFEELVEDLHRHFPDLIRRIETLRYCRELKHNLLPGDPLL